MNAKGADAKLKSKIKKNALVIITAMICGIMFTGCDAEQGELMVISGVDIKSYNEVSKEIKFTDEISEKLINSRYGIKMYIKRVPLFENEIRTMHPVDSNPWYGYVVLSVWWDFDNMLNRRINPVFRLYNSERNNPSQGETFEYDPIKRNKDWEMLINYLKEAGKIDETEPPKYE